MAELKPCPFCGGEAESYIGNYLAWVMCSKCKTGTKLIQYEAENREDAEQKAAENWNRRADK